jgi:proline iminopeptidase
MEEFVDVDDGARLWTSTQGSGRPIVLCHGGPGGTDNLSTVADMISDVVRVHRYEQRACGRSSGGPPFTMARSMEDLEVLRGHWGHRRWVVGGHSFGAALALAYALEHPDAVEAVVCLSCVVRLAGQPDWYERYRTARLERIPEDLRPRFLALLRIREAGDEAARAATAELRTLGAPTDFGDPRKAARWQPLLEAELASGNDEVNRELGADFTRYFPAPSVLDALRALEVPALLVHGDADPRPVAAVEALQAELPRSQLIVLRDVGHLPFWEAPEELREQLRQFVSSLPD